MKLSITAAATKDQHFPAILKGDLPGSISRAAEWGYQAIELHLADPAALDWAEVAAAAEKNGVAISSLGTGLAYVQEQLCFTDSRLHRRQEAVARICAHLEAARPFQAPVIIGSVRGSVPRNGDVTAYTGYLRECLKQCLEKAERENVDLVIEAINRYETNLINSAAEGAALIEQLGSKRLKLHLDTFHMNIEEPNLRQSIEQAAGCLGHMHFADSNRRHPGSGHLDFAEIVGALHKIDYRGAIAFEYLPWPDAAAAALKGKAHIEAVFKKVGLPPGSGGA